MALREYQRKRDFRITAEPRGKSKTRSRGRLRFVIQEHAASRLHYDFRLEHAGVLKSWAVPKGPSLDPSVKRLAMQVEDHPLEYGDFEGTIPKGQYGGGTVLLWDRGHWTPVGDPAVGLRKGSLKFRLDGEKLRGSWALIRMHGKSSTDGDHAWLLVKERDDEARSSRSADVTHERTESVKSGHTLAELKTLDDADVWNGRKQKATKKPITKQTQASAGVAQQASAKAAKQASSKVAKKGSTKVAKKASTKVAKRASTKVAKRASTKVATLRGPGARSSRETVSSARIEGARRAPMPARIEPERATLVKSAPSGEEWIHEIKFDGYRALCHIDKGRVRWFTRGGLDWTARFESLSPAMASLPAAQAIIDGEIAVLRPDGTTSFQDLQQALHAKPGGRLVYYGFDLLYLNGYDLRPAPLEKRKEALANLMRAVDLPPSVMYSEHAVTGGPELHAQACRRKLEGIVSKRRDRPYLSGRQRDWVKVKCAHRQEFVVGGYTLPSGSRSGLGALLLGVYDEAGALRFSGRVGTGFDQRTLRELRQRLERLEIATAPFSNPPSGARASGVRWVRPKLVIEAEFTGWTEDGLLRHPSFDGIREDKPAREVMIERADPMTTKERAKKKGGKSVASSAKRTRAVVARKALRTTARSDRAAREVMAKRAKGTREAEVAGVRLTHPERVVYPDQGITKLDLARYYERASARLLPHIAGRPLSIVRCPQGQGAKCFFQKHYDDAFPAAVKSVRIKSEDGFEHYLMVDTLEGVVSLAQIGALELHPWGSRGDDIELPDRMFFDLDPSPEVPWARVVAAARRIRERLEDLGLESFVKTTGGKGLHVVVPLARKHDWDDVKQFSKAVADDLVRAAPREFIATASKARRTGRIFVDYLRNGRGATAVAAYSPRARSGAPISVPLAWNELTAKLHSDHYHLANIESRLSRQDPWRGYFNTRQSLAAKARRALGLT